jgi:hypothetical protein
LKEGVRLALLVELRRQSRNEQTQSLVEGEVECRNVDDRVKNAGNAETNAGVEAGRDAGKNAGKNTGKILS